MRNQVDKKMNSELIGVGYGILAYIMWGLLPLYWKMLAKIPAMEILAHRIFWSFVLMVALLLFTDNWHSLTALLRSNNRKNLLFIFISSVVISINWFTYIWAVNSELVLETSMGYYINPLVVVLLSMTVFKEKLNPLQWVAIVLASIGVLIMTFQYGRIPWVALTLAVSFALYGLLKKINSVDSMLALSIETSLLMPFALAYILYIQYQGNGALGVVSPAEVLALICTGIATAAPLLFFAKATRRIKFSTVGFLQYIAPTLSFLLGVFVFKEQFTPIHLLSFSFIWAALITYSLANIHWRKKSPPVYTNKL